MYPTTLDVLADQFKSTRCCGGWVPVPLNDADTGEPGVLVTKDAVAEAPPLACGVNVMVNDALCPAGMVRGSAGPVRVNSGLLTDAEDTVTLARLALNVAVMFLLAPTTTLPKPKLAGLTANWPTAVPLPDKGIGARVFEAFEVTEMFPLALPAAWGAKLTPKVKLWPTSRSNGRLKPVRLKPVPVALT